MVKFLPKEYHYVLEIGCGEGNFSRFLKSGCEIWGCEPDERAAAVAARKLARILLGNYETVAEKIPADYFDLVICNDVIEHMEDHDWFFDSIIQKMRPGGVLVGSIPNIRHIRTLYELVFKKDWQYQDGGTLDRTHLRFFTRKSLLRTLIAHKFTIEEFAGINVTQSTINHIIQFFINFVTLWCHRDVKYLQFAFRIRRG